MLILVSSCSKQNEPQRPIKFGIDYRTELNIQSANPIELLKELYYENFSYNGSSMELARMLNCTHYDIELFLKGSSCPSENQIKMIRQLRRNYEYAAQDFLIYKVESECVFGTLFTNWENNKIQNFNEIEEMFVKNKECSHLLLELQKAGNGSEAIANYLECSTAAIDRLINKETEPTAQFLHDARNMYFSYLLLNKNFHKLEQIRYGDEFSQSPDLNEWQESLEPGVEQFEPTGSVEFDKSTIEQYIKNEEKLNEAFVSSICKTIDSISKHQIAKFEEDELDGLVDDFANIKDLYISDKQEFEKIIKDMDSTYFGTQHYYPQLKIIESDYISKVKKTRAHFVKAYKVRVDVNVDSIKIPLISTKGLKNYTEDIAADYIKGLPKDIASEGVAFAVNCAVKSFAPKCRYLGLFLIATELATSNATSYALDKISPSDADSITEILKKDIDSQSVINPEEINSFINLLNNNSRSFYEKIL